jgi:hypothetical protein
MPIKARGEQQLYDMKRLRPNQGMNELQSEKRMV